MCCHVLSGFVLSCPDLFGLFSSLFFSFLFCSSLLFLIHLFSSPLSPFFFHFFFSLLLSFPLLSSLALFVLSFLFFSLLFFSFLFFSFLVLSCLVSIVGSLRDREVACSTSDRQGSDFESCVWRTVSSQSSHHPQEVILAQFSLYMHKGGLKPDSFHFVLSCLVLSCLVLSCLVLSCLVLSYLTQTKQNINSIMCTIIKPGFLLDF